ncbi:caffeoylshikimate esterase isoform X2 [Pyrus x bretschneideri]|uniref:caffeoylshikimate esterase isoform X2 n=1 Tax=Pyrus x bretschneideri TaxID=225117 RepID=UPI00202F799A|nr:caffeoylshikimate esterase isoform X2 [Pyrus x bretschneideri]
MEVEYQEVYIRNSRGVQLFTCRWLPFSSPKALVFLCHGYGMECSGFMRECGIRLANGGYAVFGIDYEGHGRSRGARCYIKKFKNIVNDCDEFFKSICAEEEYRDKCRFLYGESMGGAVSLLLHKKDPTFWNGAVLVAPMCKIRSNKLIYQDKPRLKTALEMLRTSMSLEDTLHEVRLPFFVLHGEADTVTDPEVSRALYEKASSTDKTIKLYPGMWHGLTSGEPDGNVEIVFADIITWLEKHTSDDNSIVVQPIHTFKNAILTMNGTASPPPPTPINKQRPWTPSYFCGLKGRRLLHHSAM